MKLRIKCLSVLSIFFICFCIVLYGCSSSLKYDSYLGYDLTKISADTIEFNIYHSNTADHKWEKLTSFSYDNSKVNYIDVKLESSENQVNAILEENSVTRSTQQAIYTTKDLDQYKYVIEGFKGKLPGNSQFSIKNSKDEQPYRLYPISNSEGMEVSLQTISLDEPYDDKLSNLDNILITVIFK